jgi:outer membrane protein insertion porin family
MVFLLLGTFVVQAAVVDEVQIRSANGTAVSRKLVIGNMETTQGATFDPQVLSEDIKRLYKTGVFSVPITVNVETVSEDRLRIVLTMTPKPTVQSVEIVGNSYVKTKTLLGKLTLKQEAVYDANKAAEDATLLREAYRDKGYFKTQVEVQAKPVPEMNQVVVTYTVSEEPRYKIRRVDFVGNQEFTTRELRKAMRSRHSWWANIFSTGYLDEDQLKVDQSVLVELYANRGYLDFQVEKVDQQVEENRKWISLTVHLVEGGRYQVASVKLAGNKLYSDGELGLGLAVKADTFYSADLQRRDIQTIRTRYETAGYVDVRCYTDRQVDAKTKTLALEYRILEGAPFHIRDISITGNRVTKDKVIRRELAIAPGDLADMTKVRASKGRIQNLNYFDQVDLTPVSTEVDGQKDLDIRVSEKRTGQLMLGAGFSSEDSLVGTFEITQANFDWRNWPHFTGGGQRLRLRLDAGTTSNNFLLSFTEPWLFDKRLRLGLDAHHRTRDQDEYDETRSGAGVTLTRRWRQNWRQSLGLQIEHVELDDFDDDIPNDSELWDEKGKYWSNGITYTMTRDTRDRYLNPSRGSKLTISADLLPELLGSYSNVYRLKLSATKYRRLWWNTILSLNGDIGMVDNASGDDVAIFDRFFAGGASTLRGFDSREVGPVDSGDNPIGGKSMLLGSLEISKPIVKQLQASVFCDAGNVWKGATDWDPTDLNVSVGVGLLLNLPIGPISLAYGFPIVTQWDHLSKGGRFHFNIGYSF